MKSNFIHQLENDFIKLSFYDDGAAEIFDKKRGQSWRMGRVAYQEDNPVDMGHCYLRSNRSCCEEYPGHFHAQQKGRLTEYTLLGRQDKNMGTFVCEWCLADEWIEVKIMHIDEGLPCLMFPTPLECEALVLPLDQGRLIRKHTSWPSRFAYRMGGGHLNMRWFGGLRGDLGWMALIDEGHEDAGVLYSGFHMTPMWLKSLGQWRGNRIVRYRLTDGGYVGMAKIFRRWAQEHGLFKTLAEKIDRTPALRSLLGGRQLIFRQATAFNCRRAEDCYGSYGPFDGHVSTAEFEAAKDGVTPWMTHAQVKSIFEDARKLGMKRGMLFLCGWENGGYDELHPDIWPPDPSLGSLDEFADLCRIRDPYITTVADQYQDVYEQSPSFPKGCCVRPDGSLLPGGIWRGGQAYILNYKHSIEFAKANWQHMKAVGTRSVYVDTTTAVHLMQSWAKDDELTRSQDQQYKKEFLAWWKDQGVLLGSEQGVDWGVPYVDATNGPIGTHIPGESIPLWPLVYHDCMFTVRNVWGWHHRSDAEFTRECLQSRLYGCPMNMCLLTPADWEQCKKHFASTFDIDQWQERTALSEMTNHRYLTADYQVEQTEFANGAAIAVNFGNNNVEVDGIKIPSNGYAIRS